MTTSDNDRSRAALARRLRTRALALHHDDAQLRDAVETAKQRVAGGESDDGAPSSAVVMACSALAIGEFALARATIDAMHAQRDDPADAVAHDLVRACLVGRFHAWTGDAPAAAAWLEPAVDAVERVESDATPLVARDLLALAESLGDHASALRLRPLMRGADPDVSSDVALLRLSEGSSTPSQSAAASRLPAQSPASPPLPARVASILAHLLEGRTDAGIEGWTALAQDTDGDMLAQDAGGDTLALPYLLAVGILGADPDAARGRLRLRLQTPRAWPDWGATNIRIGDAFVEVRVRRDMQGVEIDVDQTEGALPVTLILEPAIDTTITGAHVDGQPADLTIRRRGDAMVAPVQLVLDAPRSVVLDLRGP